jgi:uncharacterized membrane protein
VKKIGIDIKARLRNKYFWVSFIALFVMLLQQLGITLPIDINAIGGTLLSMAVLLGIVVDNGSEGFKDNNKEGE